LRGEKRPDEDVLLCAHYDGMFLSPAAVDNASGTCVLLGVTEALSKLKKPSSGNPLDRTVKFIAFSAEELGLQGSFSYVKDHEDEVEGVRLLINLDEVAAGRIKGFRFQFPELVNFFQDMLSHMGLPLSCYPDPFIDTTSDHFPFVLKGVPASLLWRWRYVGGYPTHQYTHTKADTIDKIEVKDLYEYISTIARCVLRVSNVSEETWPGRHYSKNEVLTLLNKPVTRY
ncbi:MAG: M28 family metallopeptidase, partial [Candidatus Bathyarchaeia archaeon]